MHFDIHQARNLALEHFNLRVNAKRLVSYEDYNFYLKASDDREFVLKISNPGSVREELEMQNAIMEHLSGKVLPFKLPGVIPGKNGNLITTINNEYGNPWLLRLLTWVPGRLWSGINPKSPELLENLGSSLGLLSAALQDFDHSAAHRVHDWDLCQPEWMRKKLEVFKDKSQREIAENFYQLLENDLSANKTSLPKQICYNDANDNNLLVSQDLESPVINGFIDFGDALYTQTINELAVAATYAIMDMPDPLAAASTLVKGYHKSTPLSEKEMSVLYNRIGGRLLLSVVHSAINKELNPDNDYLFISEKRAWDLIKKWHRIPPEFAKYTFRHACGLEPCPKRPDFNQWLKKNPILISNIIGDETKGKNIIEPDLSVGSTDLGNNENFESLEKFKKTINRILEDANAEIGVGGYNEVRPFYSTDAYEIQGNSGPKWRTVHLGLDIWMPAGTKVLTPVDGTIHSFQNNEGERNYGPTIILEHTVSKFLTFYTLYGHLSSSSINGLEKGQKYQKGTELAEIGPVPENGNWPPHLHFQIILDMMGLDGDFPGVAFPDEKEIWLSLCPGMNDSSFNYGKELKKNLVQLRSEILSPNLSLSYKAPLHIVRAYMQYLYDENGQRYLDTNNNVPHVGHQHPRVVKAAQKQSAVLNTNTRYLHENIIRFAEELLSTFPPELCVCHFVNSGSEANELALRMAKTYSGGKDIIAVEFGYHGNTGACIDVSSYKFDGKGGKGAPAHTHIVPIPDTFRGLYRKNDTESVKKYTKHIREAIERVHVEGRNIAGFICESIISCGGQIVLPKGYLKEAYNYVRAAGGLCIADEVQVGFGRVGESFWAFELQGVIPDIVTMGKPIGNGHPLAAVVTTRAVSNAFANGMEYFNTFGGNPVSCAIGFEILQIIKDENLQENAKATGNFLLKGLKKLQEIYPIIGDVRGHGLFIGIELIKNQNTLEPAIHEAAYLANRMKENGILISIDGPYENVIKIKPPLCFQKYHAHQFLEKLDKLLNEDFLIK